MAIIDPTYYDFVNTKGYHNFIEMFEKHLKNDCCRNTKMSERDIDSYLYRKWRKGKLGNLDLYDNESIKLVCDACMSQDLCGYCTARNLEHASDSDCKENVYDTTYEVLTHLIECPKVPNSVVERIINNRKLCKLDINNIHTITDGLANIVLNECQLLCLNADEHQKILDGKYVEICIFCS